MDQQVSEPNWDELISDPPYGLNPVKRPERLYGREQALRSLMLAAMSGASKFVWGQKRIGKTSLLQVLSAKLSERADTTWMLLRMGEVTSLHEGELARVVAQRLARDIDGVRFRLSQNSVLEWAVWSVRRSADRKSAAAQVRGHNR